MEEAPGKTSSHQEGNDFKYIHRGGRRTDPVYEEIKKKILLCKGIIPSFSSCPVKNKKNETKPLKLEPIQGYKGNWQFCLQRSRGQRRKYAICFLP